MRTSQIQLVRVATLSLLTATFAWNNCQATTISITAAGPAVVNYANAKIGPQIPPDPWQSKIVKIGPQIPPDPWQSKIAKIGPQIPPDPWQSKIAKIGPPVPPNP